VAIWMAL